jgi:hypothetical protein
MPDLWRVMLHAEEPDLTCEAWLSEDVPTPTGGGGGHETITLPKRRPVVVWKQAGLWTMTLGLVFDRFSVGESVADEYADLLRMWRPLEERRASDGQARRAGDVVPMQHLSWVVTGLDVGRGGGNSAAIVRGSSSISRSRSGTLMSGWSSRRRRLRARRGARSGRARARRRRDALPTSCTQGRHAVGDRAAAYVKGGWQALARGAASADHRPAVDPRGSASSDAMTARPATTYGLGLFDPLDPDLRPIEQAGLGDVSIENLRDRRASSKKAPGLTRGSTASSKTARSCCR